MSSRSSLGSSGPGQGTPNAQSANLVMIPYNNKNASSVQWSFDVQRELPWQSFMTVAYVGSKMSHTDSSDYTYNDPPPAYLDTNLQGRRPYPYYVSQGENNSLRALGEIRSLDCPNGSYEALQTSIEKRYSSGLLLTMNYVYSKVIGERYQRNGVDNFQDRNNRRADRAVMPYDIKHNVNISYVYEPPFLSHFKGIAKAIIGGWQTSGILSLRTGLPFEISEGNAGSSSQANTPLRAKPLPMPSPLSSRQEGSAAPAIGRDQIGRAHV